MTPGDPWWVLFTNDVNEKEMKKQGLLTQKMGLMPSKNEISLLRPAINEWRPKNLQLTIIVQRKLSGIKLLCCNYLEG